MITKTAVYMTKFADDANAGILDSLSNLGYNALGKAYNAANSFGNYLQEGINGWKNVFNGLSTQPGRAAVFDQGVLRPIDNFFGTAFSSAKKALANRPPSIEEKAAKWRKDYQQWKKDHWQDLATQEFLPGGKWVHGKYVPPDLLPSVSGIWNGVKSFFTPKQDVWAETPQPVAKPATPPVRTANTGMPGGIPNGGMWAGNNVGNLGANQGVLV